jgi:hypothetical protein
VEFFLWSHLKARVFRTRPTSIPDLKQQIWQRIETIYNDLLHCVMAYQVACKSAEVAIEVT